MPALLPKWGMGFVKDVKVEDFGITQWRSELIVFIGVTRTLTNLLGFQKRVRKLCPSGV